ncbi:NAD(P)-binding protein [Desulfofundulus thermobenzoicus]|uniref:NAD(P)-binding protein n=1 Tax=Desulfofundulus thermobenzoicus TaxID=29376 RepID=A0A6N7IQ89_9FIRM|nr:NAD(P)-binding protein [Desulfofundulus thermobenzoicus]
MSNQLRVADFELHFIQTLNYEFRTLSGSLNTRLSGIFQPLTGLYTSAVKDIFQMEGEFLLRVAIIGAGPSGLACALELERLGIKPVIFERYHRIGLPVERIDMLLHLAWRPVKDQLAYLARHCHLSLMPAAPLHAIIMYGPNRRSVIRKRLLGYLIHRGRSPLSIENQLAARLSTPVNFQVLADPLEMAGQFDYVVVAEGDSKTARRLGLWQELSPLIIRGATILGQFEPRTFHLY